MKKYILIAAIICLLPLSVYAYDFETSFDENSCKLTVSGTQSGHDASVSIFKNNTLSGFKTGTIENSHFAVDFVLAYEEETNISITVSNEGGGNEITKDNIIIPACEIAREEIFDQNGNSIIVDKDVDLPDGRSFELEKYTKEETLTILEQLEGTEEYDDVKSTFDSIMASLGDFRQLAYYIGAFIKDEHGNRINYGNDVEGFILNISLSRAEFEALDGLKIAKFDEGTNTLGNPLDFDYDEDAEVLTVRVSQPGVFIMYIDHDYQYKNNKRNFSYDPKKDKSLTVTVEAEYTKFKEVYMDGKKVSKSNYSSEAGSTIITLSESYLKSLSSGEHELIVYFEDGSANGTLLINGNPLTRDKILTYAMMLVLSISFLMASGFLLKKNLLKTK